VFGFAKRSANCFPRVDDESHRPDYVNFSCPCVAILTCQPNTIKDLHVHGLPHVPQSMYFIFSQGGIKVSEIMCGDGSNKLIGALLALQCNVMCCKQI
jgi:hypothetical protein